MFTTIDAGQPIRIRDMTGRVVSRDRGVIRETYLFDTLGVSGVNDIPVGTLRAVLLYHVAPGERFAEDVVSSSRIRTVSKGFLWPSVNGGVYINDAQVIAADIDVSNGVIHVIDRVLLPG